MRDNKAKMEIIEILPTQKVYRAGNNIYKVRREFTVGGNTILEQTVSMLLDEMEKRKEE